MSIKNKSRAQLIKLIKELEKVRLDLINYHAERLENLTKLRNEACSENAKIRHDLMLAKHTVGTLTLELATTQTMLEEATINLDTYRKHAISKNYRKIAEENKDK